MVVGSFNFLFQQVLDLKTGLFNSVCSLLQRKKEKVDCRFEVSPVKTGSVFLRIGNDFLDGYGHWMRGLDRSSVSINFLRQNYIHNGMLTIG